MDILSVRMNSKTCFSNVSSSLIQTCRDEHHINVQGYQYTIQKQFSIIVTWYTTNLLWCRDRRPSSILLASASPPAEICVKGFEIVTAERRMNPFHNTKLSLSRISANTWSKIVPDSTAYYLCVGAVNKLILPYTSSDTYFDDHITPFSSWNGNCIFSMKLENQLF